MDVILVAAGIMAWIIIALVVIGSFTTGFGSGMMSVLFAVSSATVAGIYTYDNFRQLDEPRPNTTYEVKSRTTGSSGEILVLYDLNSKRNRLAELKQYPPEGFQESKMTDGQIVLVPIPKK